MIRVTAGILENNGKILLSRRNKDDPLKDKWEFPGGKIEEGEIESGPEGKLES